MYTKIQVTFDAAEPEKLAEFWGLALGYVPEPPPEGFVSWENFAQSIGLPESEFGAQASRVDPAGKVPGCTSSACLRAKRPRTASTSTSAWRPGMSAARNANVWSAKRWSG